MNEKLLRKLSKLDVAIVAHVFASGPALDLEEYLKNKTRRLLFIGHPFPYRDDRRNFYRKYESGRLVKEHKSMTWQLPDAAFYVKDALYTLLWFLMQNKPYDLYVGSDGFSAYLGLLLKKLGKVKNVVFYTIDYVPHRFQNPIMNFLYHYFDRECLKKCKIVWNVSPKMAEARKEFKNIGGEGFADQITVPLGMWDDRIPKLNSKEKKRYQIVFLGHILEKQGLDIVLDAMPNIAKKLPQIKLVVLGSGPYENTLKRKAKRLKIEEYVEFRGYIADHKVAEEELAKSTIGIAMYKPTPENFTYFADPAKLKNYLSAGLPIVLTDVPPVAKELEKRQCAILSPYDKNQLANIVVRLLENPKILEKYRNNAFRYAKGFDWNKIFPEALEKSL